MTCAADPPPGPATPDENPNRHLTRHPSHQPPGTGHASRARSYRQTCQRPQRVVAQALRHRPGGDARSSACRRWFSRRRRRRRLTERPTMRYEAGRAGRCRPAPERRISRVATTAELSPSVTKHPSGNTGGPAGQSRLLMTPCSATTTSSATSIINADPGGTRQGGATGQDAGSRRPHCLPGTMTPWRRPSPAPAAATAAASGSSRTVTSGSARRSALAR